MENAPLTRHETINANKRTRHESRTVEVFEAAPALEKTTWNGLIARIIKVTRSTLIRRANDGMWGRLTRIMHGHELSAAPSAVFV